MTHTEATLENDRIFRLYNKKALIYAAFSLEGDGELLSANDRNHGYLTMAPRGEYETPLEDGYMAVGKHFLLECINRAEKAGKREEWAIRAARFIVKDLFV